MTLSLRPWRGPLLCLALAAAATSALPSAAQASPAASRASAPRTAGQGIAVLGLGASREEAHALARAVYGSSLRPRSLDEARARVLAGDPAPSLASRETRELAELRAAITGEDAASRRLLASIAAQLGVEAILVLKVETRDGPEVPEADAGDADAGTPDPQPTARLFLADSGELDAARYAPEAGGDGPTSWRTTVMSLERRFSAARAPAVARTAAPPPTKPLPAPTMGSNEGGGAKPFYASGWFWGALGAAALVGAGFYFASRDTSDEPIHLQMRVPR